MWLRGMFPSMWLRERLTRYVYYKIGVNYSIGEIDVHTNLAIFVYDKVITGGRYNSKV